jgi:DNA-binding SARP family transcriptional activator
MLGPLRACIDDVPVLDWPQGRCRALLGYLVFHRLPASTSQLIDVFWPDTRPSSARNNLHVAVHAIRRAFGRITAWQIVLHSRDGYHLNQDVALHTDLEDFERDVRSGRAHEAGGRFAAALAEYRRAVTLHRGELLSPDADEPWVLAPREQLRLSHLDALDDVSRLQFAHGSYLDAVAACLCLLAADPCREEAHRRLMSCHLQHGQPHLAIAQFRTCERILAEQYAMRPSPQTINFVERIRRHQMS